MTPEVIEAIERKNHVETMKRVEKLETEAHKQRKPHDAKNYYIGIDGRSYLCRQALSIADMVHNAKINKFLSSDGRSWISSAACFLANAKMAPKRQELPLIEIPINRPFGTPEYK